VKDHLLFLLLTKSAALPKRTAPPPPPLVGPLIAVRVCDCIYSGVEVSRVNKDGSSYLTIFSSLGFDRVNHSNLALKQRKITMQDRHLCWPPYSFLGPAVPPTFLIFESPLPVMHPRSGVPVHNTAMICFVQKYNWLSCNVGCHVYINKQRKIQRCQCITLESYIFRRISTKF